jgi:hypothetical protein
MDRRVRGLGFRRSLGLDYKEHHMGIGTVSENRKNTATDRTPGTFRGLSVGALIFGALGGVFYWWVPLGMVFSLTGLLLGIVDGILARRRSLDYRLAIVAVLLSIAALTLDIVIAYLGFQTLSFGGQ